MGVNFPEGPLAKKINLEKRTELADRCIVRNRFVAKAYANKPPHGFHIVKRFFGSGVAEVEVNSAGNGSEASVPTLREVCSFLAWDRRVQ